MKFCQKTFFGCKFRINIRLFSGVAYLNYNIACAGLGAPLSAFWADREVAGVPIFKMQVFLEVSSVSSTSIILVANVLGAQNVHFIAQLFDGPAPQIPIAMPNDSQLWYVISL